jgi:hypothetical protein
VVYAAKHGQTALDGEGEDSPFAVATVQRIATPGVEINWVFRLVRNDVNGGHRRRSGASYLRLVARPRGFLLRREIKRSMIPKSMPTDLIRGHAFRTRSCSNDKMGVKAFE